MLCVRHPISHRMPTAVHFMTLSTMSVLCHLDCSFATVGFGDLWVFNPFSRFLVIVACIFVGKTMHLSQAVFR